MRVNYRRLHGMARQQRDFFRSADPFPHVVIDNFFEPETYQFALEQFPATESEIWKSPTNLHTFNKKVIRGGVLKESLLADGARRLFWELNSASFLRFLTELSGIDNLIGDPYLFEAGFHCSGDGAFLDVHADFSHHDLLGLERRLNLILFMNEEWRATWGGELGLYGKDLQQVRKIPPLGNRCVIFLTSDDSFHGHPDPMRLPPGVYRRSVAMYYYSVPTIQREKVSILFPEDPSFSHRPTQD